MKTVSVPKRRSHFAPAISLILIGSCIATGDLGEIALGDSDLSDSDVSKAVAADANHHAQIERFVKANCVDCHAGSGAEANFRLDDLAFDLDDGPLADRWVAVFDRVKRGEMPPADADQPTPADRERLVATLGTELVTANQRRQQTHGRVQYRRLNRHQYEQTLRDLLALPHLEVRDMLPADNSAHGFDNVGSALDLSYVQMSRYLEASSMAIDNAMKLGPAPEATSVHLEAKTNGRFRQVVEKNREAVAVGTAVGLLRQPNTAQAPWWWSQIEPPVDGRYRIQMKSFGFIWDKGNVLPADQTHVVTFFAVQGTTKRPLGSFDVGRSEQDATIQDFEAFLRDGDQIQIWLETLDDRNKGKTELAEYTAPGVAIDWLDVEGPIVDQWPPASYRSLFGDLPFEVWNEDTGLKEPPTPTIVAGVGKRAKRVPAKRNQIDLFHVVSSNPRQDAERRLVDFATRAFRRSVDRRELTDILALVEAKLDQKHTFQEAMRPGFQAILCSPEFLFLQENPGSLDDGALASRLSYFFWSSVPDDELIELARDGTLSQPAVLREQVERMLGDERSSRFVESFCGQWLDLRDITITQPDQELYPEFDQLLQSSMVAETEAFFAEMLKNDLSVDCVVDSPFAIVNGRLAKHYGIDNVDGVSLREVSLPSSSRRGGLLTQASVLKVTANGTTTSPVTRGAWVLDRILGQPAPLPPPNVPAVEPDVRGATTIREQLAKHRDDEACASCHRRIDPPGFALESYDVVGGWRDRYRSLGKGDPVKRTVQGDRGVRYRLGLPVDSTGVATNGEKFEDIDEFRSILLKDREQIARNLIERLIVYSTGGGIEFADRPVVDDIVDRSRSADFGLRTLVHEVVQSPIFQHK